MATTLYFPDDTHEVIFSEDPIDEFAKIVDERLGRDSYEMLMEILAEKDDKIENLKDVIDSHKN